jgi:hypothetical protein
MGYKPDLLVDALNKFMLCRTGVVQAAEVQEVYSTTPSCEHIRHICTTGMPCAGQLPASLPCAAAAEALTLNAVLVWL